MPYAIGHWSILTCIRDRRFVALRFHGIRRRAFRTRRPEEDLLSVGERQISSVCAVGAILRLIAIHQDFGSDGQVFLGEASPQQRIWRTAFYHPSRCSAVC